MSSITRHLIGFLAAALLGMQAGACARGDIILGARGGSLGPAANGSIDLDASTSGATDSGGASAAGSGGSAAGSFSGSAGANGMPAAAGVAAPAGTGGAAADAGASSEGARPSTGCGKDPVVSDTNIQIGGLRASYLIDLPSDYDKTRAYPLIMAFRGSGSTTDEFRGYLNLPAVTGADAIVVHPNCPNDATTWDVQRDPSVVDAMLSKLEAGLCVDQSRVFAVGHGTGALFVTMFGCLRGDVLRGIAPLSGAPPPGMCTGETAVMITQGNADPMMLGLGRGNRDFWAARNSCDLRMPAPVDPMPCVEYAACDDGYPVRYCEFDGDVGLPTFAASGLWSFFKSL
jgi:polyhydroxybutyrate depolymerase